MGVLNPKQKQLFKEQGIIKLERFLSLEGITNAQMLIYKQFEKEAFYREGNWLLAKATNNEFRRIFKILKNKLSIKNLLLGKNIEKAIAELLGEEVVLPMSKFVDILYTLPNTTNWEIPHDLWHVDVPRLAHEEEFGVQVFSFLENVKPRCGGTLAIKGSHKLFNTEKLSSKQLKTKLKQFSYFKNLMSKDFDNRNWFIENSGKVLGMNVELVELYGNIGDIYLMDLRTLHAIAPNSINKPRIMISQRYLSEKARKKMIKTNNL